MSKEDLLKELLDAKKRGDNKRALVILNENPELLSKIEFLEKKESQSFYESHKDLLYAFVLSIFLSPIFVHLYNILVVQLDSSLVVFLLGITNILTFPLIASVISFWYRSLKLPAYMFLIVPQISNIMWGVSQQDFITYSGTVLGEKIGGIIGLGILLFILGFFGIFPITFLTKRLIGIPSVMVPYSISLDLPEIDIKDLQTIITEYFAVPKMYGEFKVHNQSNSWYGKFNSEEMPEDTAVIKITKQSKEGLLNLKVILYTSIGLFTSIIRTQYCANVSNQLVVILKDKINGITLSNDQNFNDIYNYALEYTHNRFQKYVNLGINKIIINRNYFLLACGVIITITLSILKPEYSIQIFGIAGILALGISIYEVIKSREREQRQKTLNNH